MDVTRAAAEPNSTWYGARLRFIAIGVQPYEYATALVQLSQDQKSGDVVLAPFRTGSAVGIVRDGGARHGNDTEVSLTLYAQQRQNSAFASALAEFIKALFVRLPNSCRKQARASAPEPHDYEVHDIRDAAGMTELIRTIFSRVVPIRQVPQDEVPVLGNDEAVAAAEPEMLNDESLSDIHRNLVRSGFERNIVVGGVQFALVMRNQDLYFYNLRVPDADRTCICLDLTRGMDAIWSIRIDSKNTYVRAAREIRVDTEAKGPTIGKTLKAWITNALSMVQDLVTKLLDDTAPGVTKSNRIFYGNRRTGPGRDSYVGIFRVQSEPSTLKFEVLDDRHDKVLGTVSFPRKHAIELTLSTGKRSELWTDHAFKIWKAQHHAS